MRAVRDVMVLSPPLVITREETEWLADTVETIFARIEARDAEAAGHPVVSS